MTKVALLLHGWPQTELNQYFLVKYLEKKGYKVMIPNLYLIGKGWSIEKVSDKIIRGMEGNTPDLIVGISMGGLILPVIAQNYSKSKIIFISSGAYFKPDLLTTKLGVIMLKIKLFRKLLISVGDNIPMTLLIFLYRVFDPFTGNYKNRGTYEEDLKLNIKAVKSYSFDKHFALMDLICSIDNTTILQRIGNKALIFNGKKDLLMPPKRGEELHELLKNSKMIINEGEHFDVFTEKDLKEVGNFIDR